MMREILMQKIKNEERMNANYAADIDKVKGPTCVGPLILTNPLNSCTKLQIDTT
jgi:hypothetical protein